jgi:hypothetical protein
MENGDGVWTMAIASRRVFVENKLQAIVPNLYLDTLGTFRYLSTQNGLSQ